MSSETITADLDMSRRLINSRYGLAGLVDDFPQPREVYFFDGSTITEDGFRKSTSYLESKFGVSGGKIMIVDVTIQDPYGGGIKSSSTSIYYHSNMPFYSFFRLTDNAGRSSVGISLDCETKMIPYLPFLSVLDNFLPGDKCAKLLSSMADRTLRLICECKKTYSFERTPLVDIKVEHPTIRSERLFDVKVLRNYGQRK